MEKNVTIGISGMHCKNCEENIRKGLLELEEVKKVNVSLAEEKASISFDPKSISLDRIGDKLIELGYGMEDNTYGRKELSFEIAALKNGADEKVVKDTLLRLEGVEKVVPSHETKRVSVSFDSKKVSLADFEEELLEQGFEITAMPKTRKRSTTLKQGIIYGLVPHIGCIGFIAASIL